MREIFTRRAFSRVVLLLHCLACIALTASHARAAGPASPVPGSAKIAETSQVPWTIQADKLMYDQGKQLYEAEGNVKISSKDRMIEADYASVNDQTRQADLYGKVTVQYGRNWVKGEHIIWNLDTETGWLDSGVLFFSENNFFVQGESISKLSPTEFELKKGFITSCNPADPDWKIQFNSMKVSVGGTAWTRDTSFWARSWPVIYWPLFAVPVERDRQSGFLLPAYGNSSLSGIQAEIPYYWAIRDDMDATFFAQYMQKRGFMGGTEYRVNNQEWGKGVWMLNFLDDQASPSFLQDQGYPFQTQDRYWLRGKHDVDLPLGITAKIDLDYVSDRNFLQEFGSGSASFFASSVAFGQYFGRNLLYDQTSLVRESSAYFEKKRESDLLSLDIRYWENLESSVEPETTQKLPSLSYTILPKGINDTPFYYTLQSSAVNYWRKQGDTEQRLDAYPRVYYPLHWGNYMDIEPSAGLRANAYSVQWEKGNFDNFTERAVTDAKVEMSSRVNREYSVDFWNVKALQHAIRPEVSYEFANQASGGPIPQLDQLDLDQARNGVRVGFSSFLMGKEVAADDAGVFNTTYREFARFRVFQFYNVQSPPVEDPLFDTNNVMRGGFSPVGIRLDILPRKYLTVSYDLDLDLSSQGQGEAQSLALNFDTSTGYLANLSYLQIPNLSVNEIVGSTILKVYKDIYFNTYHDYSLERGLLFTQGYGIRYIRGCWGLGAGYERTGGINQFVFTIDLMGLGSLGQQTAFFGRPLFGEPHPGYQHPETWVVSR